MLNKIIVKQSKCIQLGHLYEHIFCDHLETFLHNQGVFQYVDYTLSGKTYHGGLIYIEVVFYNEHSAQYIDTINNLEYPGYACGDIWTFLS